MLNKFLDDYEQIILICAKNNYAKQQTQEVLSAFKIQRFITQKQLPRTKELNQLINAAYKIKSEHNESENDDEDSDTGLYLWIAELGSCSACTELDGQVFDEEPERPHLNCQCEIKEIDKKEAEDRIKEHKENIDKRDRDVGRLNEGMGFDEDGNTKSEEKSTGKCAKYTTDALEKVGLICVNIKTQIKISMDHYKTLIIIKHTAMESILKTQILSQLSHMNIKMQINMACQKAMFHEKAMLTC